MQNVDNIKNLCRLIEDVESQVHKTSAERKQINLKLNKIKRRQENDSEEYKNLDCDYWKMKEVNEDWKLARSHARQLLKILEKGTSI